MIFICLSHVERYIVAQSLSYHLKNYGYKIWYDYDELLLEMMVTISTLKEGYINQDM